MVAMIVLLSFMGVVIAMRQEVDWGTIVRGFIPKLSLITEPSSQYRSLLDAISLEEARNFWQGQILGHATRYHDCGRGDGGGYQHDLPVAFFPACQKMESLLSRTGYF